MVMKAFWQSCRNFDRYLAEYNARKSEEEKETTFIKVTIYSKKYISRQYIETNRHKLSCLLSSIIACVRRTACMIVNHYENNSYSMDDSKIPENVYLDQNIDMLVARFEKF